MREFRDEILLRGGGGGGGGGECETREKRIFPKRSKSVIHAGTVQAKP